MPNSILFKDDQVPAFGLAWEWAAKSVGAGQVPIARPNHPQDTLMDLLSHSFGRFVQSLDQSTSMTSSMDAWSSLFVVQRLLKAGWPMTDTASATLHEAIEQLDTLPSRLHAKPIEIHRYKARPGQYDAKLSDGSFVPCQNFYRIDSHLRPLIESGQLVPVDVRAAVSPQVRRTHKP